MAAIFNQPYGRKNTPTQASTITASTYVLMTFKCHSRYSFRMRASQEHRRTEEHSEKPRKQWTCQNEANAAVSPKSVRISSAIGVLGGKNSVGRPTKRHMSASARARIAKAQRARWAKVRATKRNA